MLWLQIRMFEHYGCGKKRGKTFGERLLIRFQKSFKANDYAPPMVWERALGALVIDRSPMMK
jgi:hypothetical protein